MAKKLSERIAERLEREKSNTRVVNKAAILALKNDIKEARDVGWSLRQIWLTLSEEKKIKVTYQAFCKQVKDYLDKETKSEKVIKVTQKRPVVTEVEQENKSVERNKGTFTFDNQAKKEELL